MIQTLMMMRNFLEILSCRKDTLMMRRMSKLQILVSHFNFLKLLYIHVIFGIYIQLMNDKYRLGKVRFES